MRIIWGSQDFVEEKEEQENTIHSCSTKKLIVNVGCSLNESILYLYHRDIKAPNNAKDIMVVILCSETDIIKKCMNVCNILNSGLMLVNWY
jgi:hypothetical protein